MCLGLYQYMSSCTTCCQICGVSNSGLPCGGDHRACHCLWIVDTWKLIPQFHAPCQRHGVMCWSLFLWCILEPRKCWSFMNKGIHCCGKEGDVAVEQLVRNEVSTYCLDLIVPIIAVQPIWASHPTLCVYGRFPSSALVKLSSSHSTVSTRISKDPKHTKTSYSISYYCISGIISTIEKSSHQVWFIINKAHQTSPQ